MGSWRLRERELDLTRPIGAGIVNVTVDSMFEGARSGTPAQAVRDGLALAEAGFGMLDIGAVAAKAGPPVPPEEEAAALVPAVEGLVTELRGSFVRQIRTKEPQDAEAAAATRLRGSFVRHDRTKEPRNAGDAEAAGDAGSGERRSGPVPISADTFSPEVARRALAAGAEAVNDISGGGEEMFALVAETGCGYVLMHIEGPPRVDRPWREYDDVVDHLRAWFEGRIEAARDLGVAEEQIAIDPGLDFDLSPAQDLEILRRLGELRALGRPLYVSLSRKDFIGAVLAGSWEGRLPAGEREWGTVAATTLAVREGADVLRLHDASSLQAMQVAAAIGRPAGSGGPISRPLSADGPISPTGTDKSARRQVEVDSSARRGGG